MNGSPGKRAAIRRQETERMSGRTVIGIALLIVGVLALAYQGFSYTVPKKAVDLGPIQVTRQERHTVPLPPILGALALIGGIAVLVLNRSSK
jgi:drug/metabolite transporter (DMT)-like permease